MRILRLTGTFSADHSESDYQYVTWGPREDVSDQGILKVKDGDAQVLFEKVVKVEKNEGVDAPRAFADYSVTVVRDNVPDGVELLELPRDMDKL